MKRRSKPCTRDRRIARTRSSGTRDSSRCSSRPTAKRASRWISAACMKSSGYNSRMTITERAVGDVQVLDITGPVTLAENTERLGDKVRSLLQQGFKKIVLNLAG